MNWKHIRGKFKAFRQNHQQQLCIYSSVAWTQAYAFFPLLCNILCILNVNFMLPTTTITAVPQYAGVSLQRSSTGYYYTLCFQVIAYKQTGNKDNVLAVRESFRLKLSIKNVFLLFSSTIQFPWQTWPKTNTPTLEVTFLLSGECLRTHTLSSFYLKRKRLDKNICQVSKSISL